MDYLKLKTDGEENGEIVNLFDDNELIKRWSLGETSLGFGVVLGLYLLLVLKILPNYMKNRQPYSLSSILTKYNAFQVASSAYIVFLYARYIVKHGIIMTRCPQGADLQGNLTCVTLVDRENFTYFIQTVAITLVAILNFFTYKVIREIYPYFIAKHLDLLDTVFFVLRKKDNQVTFLHLYHHTAMVSWTWLHLMYHPTDHFVVVGLLNSLVHVIMYAYYGISSMGPEYQKYVWWKKHVTKIQLVQFILVISDLYYQQKLTPCPLPPFFHYFCVFCIGSFFFLFLKFYFNSYSKRRTKQSIEIKVNSGDKNSDSNRFVKNK